MTDLTTHEHTSSDKPYRMRFGRFFFFTGLQLCLALGLFWLVAPNTFNEEIHQPAGVILWILLYGVPLSLFEYLYHRYLLHSAILPFLRSMHKAHTLHHGLTYVKAPVRGKEPEAMVPVTSEYPVEHEHQEEAMEFPPYALSIFLAMFVPILGIPAEMLFPHSPAILSIIVGVTIFYSAYELWHAVLHLPFERFWRPLLESKSVGKVVRRVYSFHLMHHWRPTANLAVVGLWGFAVWDHLFRTHRRPERLPLNGAQVNYHDAALQGPRWPVAQLDRSQPSLFLWSRRVEAWAARVFLKRDAS